MWKNLVAHRTPKNEPHARTSRTLFIMDFARTFATHTLDFDKAGLDSTINSVIGKKSVAHAFGLNFSTLKSGRSKPRSQGKTWPYVRKVTFIYYVSSCIAQNLIWLPNFSQKLVFFVKIKEFLFSTLHFDEIFIL